MSQPTNRKREKKSSFVFYARKPLRLYHGDERKKGRKKKRSRRQRRRRKGRKKKKKGVSGLAVATGWQWRMSDCRLVLQSFKLFFHVSEYLKC